MILSPWRRRSWLRADRCNAQVRQARPSVELLEERNAPAVLNWTGAIDTNWSLAGNWAPNTAPAANDTLVFDPTTPGFVRFTSNNNLASITVGSIVINDASPAGDFLIVGNPISLRDGITHSLSDGAATNVLLGGITFTGTQNFLNNAGPLNVTSPISMNGQNLAVNGAGNTSLTGAISGAGTSAPGLKGDYFNFPIGAAVLGDELFNPLNTTSYLGNLTPTVTQVTATINFPNNPDLGNPFSGIGVILNPDNIAARWTGNINIPTAGDYIFFTTSDDGSVLLIDGQEVVNNRGFHGAVTAQGTRTLTGGFHTIEVMFYEGGGGASMVVEWDPAGAVGREVIPASVLLRASNNLSKLGSGTLTLGGNSSYAGITTIQQGMLVAASANALGNTSGNTVIASGAALGLSGGITLAAEHITVSGSGPGGNGAIRNLGGNNTMTSPIRTERQSGPTALQNATALFSQGGYPVQEVIDGDFTNDNGWANQGNPLGAINTAVFETVSDLGSGEFEFRLHNISQFGQHVLGHFRLSVTTDHRDTFADGGVDVDATWIQLTPTFASSANGATMNIQGDNSILVNGNNPATDVFTVRASTTLNGITGIRLEVLGPGRAGNYVLTEMQVSFTDGNSRIASDADTLTLNGNLTTITGSNGGFVFSGAGNTVVNSVIIGLSTSVLKTGSGSLTFNGNNTYGAGTTVSGGTLLVNNTTGSGTGPGPVTVQTGATLAGTGSSAGNLTVELGGTVAPGGAAVENLALAGTLGIAGAYDLQINSAGQFDQLIVGQAGLSQNLNLSGTLTGTLGFTPPVGQQFTILSNLGTGNVTGMLNGVVDGGIITVGGHDFIIHYNAGVDGNDVVLESAENVAPTLTTNTGLTVLEGGSAGITVAQLLVEDVQENAAQLVYTVTSGPTYGTLHKSGVPEAVTSFTQADINAGLITYLHDGSETTSDSIDFTVSDGYDDLPVTFSITVTPQNDDPVITEGLSVSVTMSEDSSPTPFSLTLNATDAEGATLTWNISSDGGHGTASVDSPDTGNSMVISYVPVGNYRGGDFFVVRVSDGAGGIDTITVNVTIEGVNDAPSASGANPSIPYLQTLLVDLRTLVSDLETPDNSLDFSVDNAVNGTVTLLPDGYTAQFIASSQTDGSFTYSVTDGGDGSSPALSADDVQIDVNVLPPLPAPPVANNDSYSIDENTHLLGNVITDLAGADSDVNGDTMTVTQVNGLAIAVGATITLPSGAKLTVLANGSFDYNPTTSVAFNKLKPGQTASDSFTYRIGDGHGGFDDASVSITVNGVNDPPVVPATRIFRGWKNTPTRISVVRLLRFCSDPETDPIFVQNVSTPSVGTITVNPNGSITVRAPGYRGPITFTYEVTDGNSAPQTIAVTLRIRRRR